MEYAYEKLMKEEKLTLSELPKDAKTGIETIKKIERAITMTEKKGHKVRPEVMDKIKTNDKWVTREILDYMEGKDSGQGAMPHNEGDVVDQIEGDVESDEVKIDPKGVAIDKELEKLIQESKTSFETLDELKSFAPLSYSVIFSSYDESGDNGIETSFHKVMETEKGKFTLTKI